MKNDNLLINVDPGLVEEWSDKNGRLMPDMVTYGSNKMVWWKGRCGHEWQATPKARHGGENCPFCAGKRVLPGFNDLATMCPGLIEEWDDDEIKMTEVTAGSQKKVRWKGRCGHIWKASVKNRAKGSGCPYCSSNRILEGFNDLNSRRPELAAEWSGKNLPLTPEKVAVNANLKAWWKCSKGHEWQAIVSARSGGSRCPYCTGTRLLSGYNDLGSAYPELAAEWSEKNRKKPEEVFPDSRENVWWICSQCGHEWKSVIHTRVKGSGCPSCRRKKFERERMRKQSDRKRLEIFEKKFVFCAVMYYAEKAGTKLYRNDDSLIGLPITFYLPDKKVALEYMPYGKKISGQERKVIIVENDLCRKSGIKLVRIIPRGGLVYDDCICVKQNGNTRHAFGKALQKSFGKMDVLADVDINRDKDDIFRWYLENEDK